MQLSPIQKQLIHNLVNRHENRRDYGGSPANRSPRRTMLKIDHCSYPDYFHASDAAFRRMFNAEVESLHRLGFVTPDWERFNEGEVLHRVILSEEALPEIYRQLERAPKSQLYNAAASLLNTRRENAPPELEPFYRDILEKLKHLEPPPAPIKPEKPEELAQLLTGLHAVFEPREHEVAKRLLSVRLYGDSKRWQELERSILHLLKNYCLTGVETEAGDAAILAERGIVDNPIQINLAGPLVLSTPRGRVDLALFYPDLGLSSQMAGDLTVEESSAEAIVTVENKASFYHYLREGPSGHLVIYLGGYHNSPRRKLLQKLYRFFRERKRPVPFYHWGDLDLGGISIWKDLRAKTGIPFEPLFMDEETYVRHLHLGHPVSDAYCRKLAPLLDDPATALFHPLIRRMLKEKVRVEQEAVNISCVE